VVELDKRLFGGAIMKFKKFKKCLSMVLTMALLCGMIVVAVDELTTQVSANQSNFNHPLSFTWSNANNPRTRDHNVALHLRAGDKVRYNFTASSNQPINIQVGLAAPGIFSHVQLMQTTSLNSAELPINTPGTYHFRAVNNGSLTSTLLMGSFTIIRNPTNLWFLQDPSYRVRMGNISDANQLYVTQPFTSTYQIQFNRIVENINNPPNPNVLTTNSFFALCHHNQPVNPSRPLDILCNTVSCGAGAAICLDTTASSFHHTNYLKNYARFKTLNYPANDLKAVLVSSSMCHVVNGVCTFYGVGGGWADSPGKWTLNGSDPRPSAPGGA